MFTEDIYRQYLVEIHRKQREMIILLRNGIGEISEDRMQKALTWHMKREIRLAVLVQKFVRSLSVDSKGDKGLASRSDKLVGTSFPIK
jgi:hypothetical protein